MFTQYTYHWENEYSRGPYVGFRGVCDDESSQGSRSVVQSRLLSQGLTRSCSSSGSVPGSSFVYRVRFLINFPRLPLISVSTSVPIPFGLSYHFVGYRIVTPCPSSLIIGGPDFPCPSLVTGGPLPTSISPIPESPSRPPLFPFLSGRRERKEGGQRMTLRGPLECTYGPSFPRPHDGR